MLRSCHFDLEMCFGPQLRALFQQLNSQKCSDPKVCLAFWLRSVLRATAACTRHSRVYLWSFDFETGAAKLRKTQCFVTFLPFRALWSSFYLLSLIWLLPHLLLHQSISQKFHFLQIYLIIHFNTFHALCMYMYTHVQIYEAHTFWTKSMNVFLSGCVQMHAVNAHFLIHLDVFWPSPCWRGPWFLIDPWLVSGTWTGHKTSIKWPHNKRSPNHADSMPTRVTRQC